MGKKLPEGWDLNSLKKVKKVGDDYKFFLINVK